MPTIQEAQTTLARAEADLRQMIEQALREQRYADVAEIARLADGLSQLLNNAPLADAARTAPVVRTTHNAKRPSTSRKSPKKDRRNADSDYPKFIREGDRLVKIGWSKKNRAAYEHRAPRAAVFACAQHLTRHVADGQLFRVEDLTPIPDPNTGQEVPAYQIYLTLRWFQNTGAIQKKGRDGYILRRPRLTADELERQWASLPQPTL